MNEKKSHPRFQQSNGACSCPPTSKKPRLESSSLFQGSNEIMIVHKDEEYNLRITRNGKLILTK